MAWSIEHHKVAVRCLKVPSCYIDCYSPFLLLFGLVHDIGKSKVCFAILFSFLDIGPQLFFRYKAEFIKQVARKCALATVHVANYDQIEVLALFLRGLYLLTIVCIQHLGVRLV